MIHEKISENQKSRDTVPLRFLVSKEVIYHIAPTKRFVN
jgi:hypothetical protein